MEKTRIMKYQLDYKGLTKELEQDFPDFYNAALCGHRVSELLKGYKAVKIGKSSRSGTKVTYKTLENANELEAEYQTIRTIFDPIAERNGWTREVDKSENQQNSLCDNLSRSN